MAARGRSLRGELARPSQRAEALSDLHVRLRVRYPAEQCALFHEVRNVTGFEASPRYADALAMGLWPSRGLQLEGFECKVDRGDWLRELRQPEKADEIAPYCDLWWLVSPAEGVASIDEIPPTWGWLVPHGKALKVVKPATPNASPRPIDRAFLASVFRAAQGEASIAPRLQAMRDEMVRERDRAVEYAEQRGQRNAKELREAVQAFEQASGLSINHWSAGEIGQQVRALQALERDGLTVRGRLESARDLLDRHREVLVKAITELAEAV